MSKWLETEIGEIIEMETKIEIPMTAPGEIEPEILIDMIALMAVIMGMETEIRVDITI